MEKGKLKKIECASSIDSLPFRKQNSTVPRLTVLQGGLLDAPTEANENECSQLEEEKKSVLDSLCFVGAGLLLMAFAWKQVPVKFVREEMMREVKELLRLFCRTKE